MKPLFPDISVNGVAIDPMAIAAGAWWFAPCYCRKRIASASMPTRNRSPTTNEKPMTRR